MSFSVSNVLRKIWHLDRIPWVLTVFSGFEGVSVGLDVFRFVYMDVVRFV